MTATHLPSTHPLPTHHLSDEWLVDYAAGAAPEPVALLVATHLAYCPTCRAANARLEAVGGALLDEIAPASLSDGAWARVAAALDEGASYAAAPAAPAPASTNAALPAPLRRYAPDGLAHLRWSRIGVHAGRVLLPCPVVDGYQAALLKIDAGRAFVHHAHRGEELLVVLEGDFADQTGRYQVGDVAIYDEAVAHRPIAGSAGACICLALSSAPIRMTGFFTRLLNPFLRS
jgi:putative transcriptional regulator